MQKYPIWDTVIEEPDGNPHVIEVLDELDHIGRIAAKAIELFNQDHIPFFHFHLQ